MSTRYAVLTGCLRIRTQDRPFSSKQRGAWFVHISFGRCPFRHGARLSREEWNARQIIGNRSAVTDQCRRYSLRMRASRPWCSKCWQGDGVDLTDVVWIRDSPIN